jgi:hypothetical protein
VLLCVGIVAWQLVQILLGRKSKLGSCCAKGCDPAPAKPQAADRGVQFIPVERLTPRR